MPTNRLPPPVPPTKESRDSANEALIPVRMRVRDGQAIGLVDMDGNDLGLPVTTQKSAQGVINTIVRMLKTDYDALAVKDPTTEYHTESGIWHGTVQIAGVGSDSATPTPKALSQIKTVLQYGNSFAQYGDYFQKIGHLGLVNNGSGFCSVVQSNPFFVGMRGWIANSNDQYWSAETVITACTPTQFTFALDPRAAPNLADTIYPGMTTERVNFVADIRNSRGCYFHALNAALGHRFVHLGNKASNGQCARDMLLELDWKIFNMSPLPDAVMGEFGANESRVLGLTPEAGVVFAQQVITRIVERGIAVFVQPWIPCDTHDSQYATQGKNAIRFNRLMEDWAKNKPHVYLMPGAIELRDATSTLGLAKANVLHTDGVHMSGPSSYICVLAAKNKVFAGLAAPTNNRLPGSIVEATTQDAACRLKFDNPLLLTTTGGTVSGGTGVVPNKVAIGVTGSATVSGVGGGTNFFAPRTLANDGDECGNNVVVRCNFTAVDDEVTIDLTGNITGLAVGDKWQVGGHLKSKLISGMRPKVVGTYNRVVQAGIVYTLCDGGAGSDIPSTGLYADTDDVHIVPKFRVSASVTGNYIRVWIIASGAGVVDIEFGRPLFELFKA